METERIESLLRLTEEPYDYYDESAIHQLLDKYTVEICNSIKNFYLEWRSGRIEVDLPVKQVFSLPSLMGDYRVMPCQIKTQDEIIKVVKVIGTNEEERSISDKISVGKAMLLHPYDNYVQAIYDVCSLSSFRTAAISALAFNWLCRGESNIALIGAGRIGFYTTMILHRWLGVDKFFVNENNPLQMERFKKAVDISFPQVSIKPVGMDHIYEHCQAVFMATNSTKALIGASRGGKLKFISSVGADADNLSELDSSMLSGRRLVVDSIQSTCLGDLKRWIAQKLLDKSQIMELREIPSEKSALSLPQLFISTGVAVQDALVCQFIHRQMKVESDHLQRPVYRVG